MTRSVLVKKQKTKGKNEFQGRWRITWMAQWDQEYVDEEVEGYFKFGAGGHGEFEFGYIQGSMDHRTIVRGGEPTIEFSW